MEISQELQPQATEETPKPLSLITFITLSTLLFVIICTTGESLHAQLLKFGFSTWDNYGTLRKGDIQNPDCTLISDIDAQLQMLKIESQSGNGLDLFEETFDEKGARQSLIRQNEICQQKFDAVAATRASINPAVDLFRTVESSVAQIAILAINAQQNVLILLIFLTATVTTIKRHHLSLRPIETVLDYRFSIIAQLTANSVMAVSAIQYRSIIYESGVAVLRGEITYMTIAGFSVLSLISLFQLFNLPKNLKAGGKIQHALLSVPLYSYMILIAANHFIIKEHHVGGLVISFNMIFNLTGVYIFVALYLWVGMLLKQTYTGELVFNFFKPWKLPPELMAFVAVATMAIPTAYTGGSGIIVLAMGAVVYQELRRVGTRRQFALAATAMTGSSGVVLRPCLLILVIAMTNNEVVSDDLYNNGVLVFLLTISLFFIFALLTKKNKLVIAPPNEAIGPVIQSMKPLLTYGAVVAAIVLFYRMVLDAKVDEFNAPIILPVVALGVIIFERTLGRKLVDTHSDTTKDDRPKQIVSAVKQSILGTQEHIGALLLFMGSTFTIAGVSGGSSGPSFFDTMEVGSPFLAMSVFVVTLVMIGMFVEAMAAVVLISFTLASVAYSYGIDPVHFWMTALVALELGFLTPPVALNHLFTRQVVGDDEANLAAEEGDSFWYRHERILLPIAVMSTTLIIVAFGPLVWMAYK